MRELGHVSHKGKQAYAPAGARWLHLYVKPDRVRADYLNAADEMPFDPGYEGLLVELVFAASERATTLAVYRAVRDGFRDSEGCTWYAVKPRPIGATRTRVSLATPLEPLLNGRRDLSTALSRSALDGVGRLLDAVAMWLRMHRLTPRWSRRRRRTGERRGSSRDRWADFQHSSTGERRWSWHGVPAVRRHQGQTGKQNQRGGNSRLVMSSPRRSYPRRTGLNSLLRPPRDVDECRGDVPLPRPSAG